VQAAASRDEARSCVGVIPTQQFELQSIGFFAGQMAVAASDAIRSAMS
jgi:hypothetical protein